MATQLLGADVNSITSENNVEISWTLKLHAPSASDSLPEICSRETPAHMYQEIVQDVHNHIITKSLKRPKCPLVREWIHKSWCIHTNGILSSSEIECHTSTHSHQDNLWKIMLNKRQISKAYGQYVFFKLKSKQNETYCFVSHTNEEVKLYFKSPVIGKH